MRRIHGLIGLVAVLGLAGLALGLQAAGEPGPGDPGWTPEPAEVPDDGKLRVIVFGAHPDDAEIRAGGVGAKWAERGHHVKFVSTTNGDIGHRTMSGGVLAKRREREVENAADSLGIDEVEVLDIHDGELMPTLENRKKIVRLIREWKADLVIAHRPNDYHPDHRYTGILMQDAAYMVTVPHFCPDTPHLKDNPVFMYGIDGFERPNPFRADVIVSIDGVVDRKVKALVQMESQFVEGGCCSDEPVPQTEAELESARNEARQSFRARFRGWADEHRDRLKALYGEDAAGDIEYAEAFEICEYGAQPSKERLAELFPFDGIEF
jgi:LmbE family N-acetylglucosaminyl deacetylase